MLYRPLMDMHPGGRQYVGRVDTNADLHTVLGYAVYRAFLGSRCITLAEPSFTPIHTDKVGKSTRHGITPTVRALFWMQNYNCVGIRNCRVFLGSRQRLI